jgi:hypothetical protein
MPLSTRSESKSHPPRSTKVSLPLIRCPLKCFPTWWLIHVTYLNIINLIKSLIRSSDSLSISYMRAIFWGIYDFSRLKYISGLMMELIIPENTLIFSSLRRIWVKSIFFCTYELGNLSRFTGLKKTYIDCIANFYQKIDFFSFIFCWK